MKSYTEQELEEKYKQLPEGIEEAIFSVGMEKTLEEIGKKYKLQIDQLGILANETRLVMLGLTHPKDFINNLAERLELEKEPAKNIAQEINQRIFYAIREELKKMHNIDARLADGQESIDSELKTEPPAEKQKILATPFEYKLKSEEAVRAPLNPARIQKSPVAESPITAEPQTVQISDKSDKKEEVKNPPDQKYPAGDPYREPII